MNYHFASKITTSLIAMNVQQRGAAIELWLEYLVRHKLQEFIPTSRPSRVDKTRIVVYDNHPTDYEMWTFFLYSYRNVIKSFSDELERKCSVWAHGWSMTPAKRPNARLGEQKDILFTQMHS